MNKRIITAAVMVGYAALYGFSIWVRVAMIQDYYVMVHSAEYKRSIFQEYTQDDSYGPGFITIVKCFPDSRRHCYDTYKYRDTTNDFWNGEEKGRQCTLDDWETADYNKCRDIEGMFADIEIVCMLVYSLISTVSTVIMYSVVICCPHDGRNEELLWFIFGTIYTICILLTDAFMYYTRYSTLSVLSTMLIIPITMGIVCLYIKLMDHITSIPATPATTTPATTTQIITTPPPLALTTPPIIEAVPSFQFLQPRRYSPYIPDPEPTIHVENTEPYQTRTQRVAPIQTTSATSTTSTTSATTIQPNPEYTCVICMENQRTVVFSPCNHLCTCTSCAANITTCSICRTAIHSKVNVYIS